MTDIPQSPAEVEQKWLAQLEQECQLAQTRLTSALPNYRAATVGEIASVITYTQNLENYFRSYEPTALYLRACGLPSLLDRVVHILADVRNAQRTYAEMHQSALDAEAKRSAIGAQISTDWFNTVQGTMQHNKNAFDASMKQWTADFTRTCVHCGYNLGDMYYTLSICPNCKLLLRGGRL